MEVLFVLLLVGLLGSLVVPRMSTVYDGLVLREQRQDILLAIDGLRYRALSEGRAIRLEGQGAFDELELTPADAWGLQTSSAIEYLPNGACLGGTIDLVYEESRRWRYRLRAPFCRPELVESDAG